MAKIRRLNIAQEGGSSKTVAFTDDIKLTSLVGGNLITVSADGKTATVAVDSTKLTVDSTAGNVKINTPLELAVETSVPATDDGKLHAVSTAGGVKLYWGANVVEAHDPEEGYVTEQEFNAHADNEGTAKHLTAGQLALISAIPAGEAIVTDGALDAALLPIETDITALKSVTTGYTGEGSIKADVEAAAGAASAAQTTANQAVTAAAAAQTTADAAASAAETAQSTADQAVADAAAAQTTANQAATAAATADAKAQGAVDVIGVWTTISDKTVKAAIEENKAEILALKGNHFIVVDNLPAVGEPNCIYLIPKAGSETGNVKEEWIYVNNAWEKIGDTAVDLSEYAKTTEVQTYVTNAVGDETTRATGVEGTLASLTTDAKGNLVAAINEVDAHADAAAAVAATALQTAEGDSNVSASVSGTKVTVGVVTNSDLAKILAACTLTEAEEE